MNQTADLITRLNVRTFRDHRGIYRKLWAADAGDFLPHQVAAVECPEAGTFRGLHWQAHPYGERKLVTCQRGAIFDIAVDMDPASPTYKRWHGVTLNADDDAALLIPPGHAHGFLSLSPDTLVVYMSDADYAPQSERGLCVTDPGLGISLPMSALILSDKDRSWPPLASFS